MVQQSGAPRGSLYHYFDGKLQMAREALLVHGERVQAFIAQALASKRAPAQKVLALFEAFARRSEEAEFRKSCPFGCVALDLDADTDDLRPAVAQAFLRWQALIATHFEPLVRARRRNSPACCSRGSRAPTCGPARSIPASRSARPGAGWRGWPARTEKLLGALNAGALKAHPARVLQREFGHAQRPAMVPATAMNRFVWQKRRRYAAGGGKLPLAQAAHALRQVHPRREGVLAGGRRPEHEALAAFVRFR